MVPYYRSVASLITFGMSPREIMLAQFARGVDPSSGGRQMPGHYGIAERNIMSVSSPVATQILHATGIAWAAKLRKTEQVDDHLSGRGLVQPGRLPRGAQLRRRAPPAGHLRRREQRLRDQRARCRSRSAVEDIAIRAAGYNMPGVIVDGADVLDCYRAGKEAIDRARAGEGPTLIEAKVTRLTAHSSDDQQTKYRSAEELEAREGPRPAAALPRAVARRPGLLDEETEAADGRRGAQGRRGRDRLGRGAGRSRSGHGPAPRVRRLPPARMDDPLWTGARFIGDGGPWGALKGDATAADRAGGVRWRS